MREKEKVTGMEFCPERSMKKIGLLFEETITGSTIVEQTLRNSFYKSCFSKFFVIDVILVSFFTFIQN